ncbi:MAG: protein YgfX [Hyphomicrobiaceae bacterium]
MQPDNVIVLRRSPTLALLIALVHGGGLACLPAVALVVWIKLALAAAVGVSLVLSLRRVALLCAPNAIVELGLGSDGTLQYVQQNGQGGHAVVLADSAVHALMTVVRLQAEGERWARSVVVLPDSTDGEQFRRLRVWLRWQAALNPG